MKYNSRYIDLIFQKASSDLKAESRRGTLGLLWWILEPVLYVGVFYIIFSLIFKRGDEAQISSLLTALIVWKWFDSSVRQSSMSIVNNTGLIRQIHIPKVILPFMVVTTSAMKFIIIFMVLIVFLISTNGAPTAFWISIPLVMFVQLVVCLAVGCLLAALVPFLPDIRMIIDNGMTLLFFLSGIFFNINNVSSDLKFYLYLNPMVGLIESYRLVLIENKWPDFNMLFIIFIASSFVLFVAQKILFKYDREYMKVL